MPPALLGGFPAFCFSVVRCAGVLWPGSRPRQARHFLCANKESTQRKSPRSIAVLRAVPCATRTNGLSAELALFVRDKTANKRSSDSPRHPASRARRSFSVARRSRGDRTASPFDGSEKREASKDKSRHCVYRHQRGRQETPFPPLWTRRAAQETRGTGPQARREDCLSSVCPRQRGQKGRVPQPSRSAEQRRGACRAATGRERRATFFGYFLCPHVWTADMVNGCAGTWCTPSGVVYSGGVTCLGGRRTS